MASHHTLGIPLRHLNFLLQGRRVVSRNIFALQDGLLLTSQQHNPGRCLYFRPALHFHSSAVHAFPQADKQGGAKVSLAEEILSSKVASESSSSDEAKKEENRSTDKKDKVPMPKWQKYGYLFFGVLMGGSLFGNAILFSLPDQDEHGNTVEDEYSSLPFPTQHLSRLKNRIFTTKKSIEEPFSDKLLPDPLEPPYHQPKYTIVLGRPSTCLVKLWYLKLSLRCNCHLKV